MIQPSKNPIDSGTRSKWFADATPDQKTAAVHALLAVAVGDGTLDSAEKTAIAEACGRLGVSSDDVARALSAGMPSNVEPPEDATARAELLLDAAAVMVADERIDSRELAVLLMVGKSLGFGVEEVTAAAVRAARALESNQARCHALEQFLLDRGAGN